MTSPGLKSSYQCLYFNVQGSEGYCENFVSGTSSEHLFLPDEYLFWPKNQKGRMRSTFFTTEPTCPTIPSPVSASVTIARTIPTIAARPLSSSEKRVTPWGMRLSLPSIVTRARLGAIVHTFLQETKEVVESEATPWSKRGVALTKADEFIFEVLRRRDIAIANCRIWEKGNVFTN